tara:strand:- start:14652 stop:15791 length:1140 start_codon:yes stop_codon:yes gene_type:complete
MGACASRVEAVDDVEGASHLEASPAGVGAGKGKVTGKTALVGCGFVTRRRGFGITKPAVSPTSVPADAGAASPVAKAGETVPHVPPVRTSSSRTPIPRTASGGRGGEGPGANRNKGLGHVEGDYDPDGKRSFGFDTAEGRKKFLGMEMSGGGENENLFASDDYASDYGDSDDILTLSSARVRKWDEQDSDVKSWQIYSDLREEAVQSFQMNFPQRERIGENKNGALAADVFKEPPVPSSLTVLASLAAAATQSGDATWATCNDEVRSLLTEDVVYVTMENHRVCGREAVLEKMNASVAKLAKRMGKSINSSTDSSTALPKKASRVKVSSTGPTRQTDKKGKEVWIVHYAFDLLLMKIKVKETFRVDKFGKIKELTRARA